MGDKNQDVETPEDAAAATVAPAPSEGSAASLEDSAGVFPSAGRVLTAEALREQIGQWCADHLYNSPVSRATEAFNYLTQTAIPDLEARILKEMT